MLLPCASEPPPRRILVTLPTWVGDFVMSTPFLRAVRTHFPQAHVAWLAEANLQDIIAGMPWVNETFLLPPKQARAPWSPAFWRFLRRLRAARFDWAVLLPNSFRSALVARLAGARRRIGYARDGRRFLLTDALPPKNRAGRRFTPLPLVEYYADLAEAIGCPRPDDRLQLFPTAEDESGLLKKLQHAGVLLNPPVIVLSPGARYGAAKCWLPERFAAVADRLVRARGATVLVTCGPGEEPIARAIRDHMTTSAVVFENPRLSLGETKALIARANLLICNDAGLRHFARAFNVPVVTVFGPTHPEWTRTSYARERIVRIDVDCGPCQQRVCPLGHLKCMTGVTIDAVVDAAEVLLDSGAQIPLCVAPPG